MAQTAGQMLPQGNPAAVGALWVLANGANFSRFTGGRGGGYFARIGWRSGMVGIGRFKIPSSPGWVVLLDDNPAGTTLPPDTPTAINPPTAPPGAITIAAIGAQVAGPVPVNGTISPNQPVQCAQVVAGVPGGFTAMTVTGTTWNGTVTCSAGSRQIRARMTNLQSNYADSNSFTVT